MTARLSPRAEATVQPPASTFLVGFTAQQRDWGHILAVVSHLGQGRSPVSLGSRRCSPGRGYSWQITARSGVSNPTLQLLRPSC